MSETNPPKIHILSTQSHPQGVACKALVQTPDGPVEIDTMVVQVEGGGFQMNWRSTTPWAAWKEPYDAVLDYNEIITAVEPIVLGVAGKIWRTLPTFKAPAEETP